MRPEYDDLRAETLVVNMSLRRAFREGDAERFASQNIVWVGTTSNKSNGYNECIRELGDMWNLANFHTCDLNDSLYYHMLSALETGKALLATAAIRQRDGTVVLRDNVFPCGDMMEHCFAVPGVYSTSRAAATVSSAAFHLFQTYERAEDVVDALKSCAEDVGDPGVDRIFGHGIINFRCAEAMLPVIER